VGRSRGGLTTKIRAPVDRKGRSIQILITPGQAHDLTGADVLLANLQREQYSVEEKIRIVLNDLRGESSIAELCRREGIVEGLYYEGAPRANKRRLAGDTARSTELPRQTKVWGTSKNGLTF
jgi:transposase-like protein